MGGTDTAKTLRNCVCWLLVEAARGAKKLIKTFGKTEIKAQKGLILKTCKTYHIYALERKYKQRIRRNSRLQICRS